MKVAATSSGCNIGHSPALDPFLLLLHRPLYLPAAGKEPERTGEYFFVKSGTQLHKIQDNHIDIGDTRIPIGKL
jgi:hypothetical protein